MKKILSLLGISALILSTMPVESFAGSNEGQRIFKMKMRKACRFSGHKFAHSHTQLEWQELKEKGKFKDETKRLCPRLDLDTIKSEWWDDVYLFTYEYAEDSGKIPSC